MGKYGGHMNATPFPRIFRRSYFIKIEYYFVDVFLAFQTFTEVAVCFCNSRLVLGVQKMYKKQCGGDVAYLVDISS
jgi:hypothetical protein